MSCGVGCRGGSDLVLLWLRYRPAAIALIGPLTWEPPYAMGATLKRQKRKKKEMKNERMLKMRKKRDGKTPKTHAFHLPFLFFFFFFFFCLFRATPTAYGSSQVRGRIGATAANLHHSHSNLGSEPGLRPTPQLMATPDPWARPGIESTSHGY